jgi:hypothetical protein
MPTPPENQRNAERDLELLREYLKHGDAPCPLCGYNLRALTDDRCPECGNPFKLQIGSAQAQFGLFLAFLAPMFMMAGFAMFLAVRFAYLFVNQWRGPTPGEWGPYVILAVGLVEGAALPIIYRRRAALLRCSKPQQFLTAMISWSLNLLAFTICFTLGG